MRHLNDGALRRLIDEPLALRESAQTHLAGCPTCQARLERVAETAARAADLMIVSEPSTQPAAAFTSLRARLEVAPGPRRLAARWGAGLPRFARPLLIAAVLLVVTSVGVVAAPSLAPIFQPQQVIAVPVDRPDAAALAGMPDLSSYGTIAVTRKAERSTVLSADEASALSGLTPPAAPAGYSGRAVTYQVIGQTVATFTFSADRARAAALKAGRPAPDFSSVPRINGTVLTITAGPAVAAIHGTIESRADLANLPLILVVSKVPEVRSSGATVPELERFLLAQPGIQGNAALTAQIRALVDPVSMNQLAIPVPVDMATSENVSVNGAPAVLITEKTGLVRAVVWEPSQSAGTNARLYAVAGHFDAAEILKLAAGIQ